MSAFHGHIGHRRCVDVLDSVYARRTWAWFIGDSKVTSAQQRAFFSAERVRSTSVYTARCHLRKDRSATLHTPIMIVRDEVAGSG
jgi:hypothetical protein